MMDEGHIDKLHASPPDDNEQDTSATETNPVTSTKELGRLSNDASGSASTFNVPNLCAKQVDLQIDVDSAAGDEDFSTFSTVRSSIYQFMEENGRTYHQYREGKYYLPNDEEEQDRLDLQHNLFLLTLDGCLFIAPIKDLQGGLYNVLDIGTGTGIWAIEFANQFPNTTVIGTDLCPTVPEFGAPNCIFEVDDVEDPWLFTYKFDYIHGRALATCFKSHIPVIASAFTFLRPGGYLELQDCIVPFRCIDDTLSGTRLEHWANLIIAGTAKLGKDWTRVSKYKQYLEEAGFVDVVEKSYEWPVGTWVKGKRNKTLGAWYREDLLIGLHAFSIAVLTRGLGMSVSEIDELLVGVRDDITGNSIHVYIPVRVVYGRKPT